MIWLVAVWQFCNFKLCAEGGTRTHEANARDLKTRPFDHSGTPADSIDIKYVLYLWATRVMSITTQGGTRTHDNVLEMELIFAVSQF